MDELCDAAGLDEELCVAELDGFRDELFEEVFDGLEEVCEDFVGFADELCDVSVGFADELGLPPSSHRHQDLICGDRSEPQSFLMQSLVASMIFSMVAGWQAQLFVSGLQYLAASALTHLAAH